MVLVAAEKAPGVTRMAGSGVVTGTPSMRAPMAVALPAITPVKLAS
jgi:hypothetical protein